MNDRIADTRQCPYCRQWIAMPARRQREAFEAHKRSCPEAAPIRSHVIATNDPDFFSPDCGLCGADIAAAPFHACATMCDCGRGPILQGNGTPDVCATCYLEAQRQPYINRGELIEERTATVKRADLFGNVIDTFRTESELNGHRATQGTLL